jgi:hypothetical protein
MTVNVTLTFQEEMLQQIDNDRGDIKRSKFIARLLQQTYQKKQQKSSSENKDEDIKKRPSQSHRDGGQRQEAAIVPAKPHLVVTKGKVDDSAYE